MDNPIHIGTSGWSYKDWKEKYYPKELKSTEWLSYYAREFRCTEINTSFYHLPKPQVVTGWAQKVPEGFKFCPKISKYITHIKRLHEPEESLTKFFDIFDPVKKHLGPILIQLPPSLKFEPEKAEYFFSVLKKSYADYDFAWEVRHSSWLEKESIALLKQYNIGIVISQSGVGFPYTEEVTSPNIYIRFHGPEKLYASSYTDEQMKEYAHKIHNWAINGHTIWCFFNNDWFLNAVNNARTLEGYLGELMGHNIKG